MEVTSATAAAAHEATSAATAGRASAAGGQAQASKGMRVIDALAIVKDNRASAPVIRPDVLAKSGAGPWTDAAEDSVSALKFDVVAADVLARFWIDERSRHVVVTMYQRDTGEVIRQTPPREVLDVVAVLQGCGLGVDTTT